MPIKRISQALRGENNFSASLEVMARSHASRASLTEHWVLLPHE